MNSLHVIILSLFLTLTSHHVLASGQRTTTVTFNAINSYIEIDLSDKYAIEPILHYVGTVNDKWHLLMITKSSSSEDEDGNIGMPWSYVNTYKISAETITIHNGWDITNKIKNGGLEIYPSSCPELYLSLKKKQYHLEKGKNVIKSCLY